MKSFLSGPQKSWKLRLQGERRRRPKDRCGFRLIFLVYSQVESPKLYPVNLLRRGTSLSPFRKYLIWLDSSGPCHILIVLENAVARLIPFAVWTASFVLCAFLTRKVHRRLFSSASKTKKAQARPHRFRRPSRKSQTIKKKKSKKNEAPRKKSL